MSTWSKIEIEHDGAHVELRHERGRAWVRRGALYVDGLHVGGCTLERGRALGAVTWVIEDRPRDALLDDEAYDALEARLNEVLG